MRFLRWLRRRSEDTETGLFDELECRRKSNLAETEINRRANFEHREEVAFDVDIT